MNINKIIVGFLGGFIFSFFILAICLVSDELLKTYIVNAGYFSYVLPFSNSLGMLITDKIYYQNRKWNILGLIFSILSNFLAFFIVLDFGEFIEGMNTEKSRIFSGYLMLFGLPLIMMIFSAVGYNLGEWIGQRRKSAIENRK
ncbi:MAG: hypothetical protein NT056_08395 [Proteobacteria bacterium]|nr:hypothetical protein [Pseudomonadota bacterium]